MRAQEFTSKSADEVWNYVKQIHPDDEQGSGFLQRLIHQYPQYQLKSVPLASLVIHDPESDDPDDEPPADRYGRVMIVDPEYAGEVSVHNIDRRPIVIDDQGYILDGNHRAWAAAELMGRDSIRAWVPVKKSGVAVWEQQELSEIGDSRIDYQPNRKRKNSLFHTTVDGHWIDVFFDRSFTGTLQITFTVDLNYESSIQLPQGTVFRIFSAVLQIIKERLPEYMRKARPPKVSFTAKGDNRVSLYRRMFVPVINEILGPKWRLTEHPGNIHLFIWEPMKKNETNPT